MEIVLKDCPICEESKWQYLDELRDRKYWYDKEFLYEEPIGFKICMHCGFLTYDYEKDEELIRRYKMERNIINFNCIITANRKLMYHRKFLKDLDLKNKKVLDYGCGIGLLLKMLKDERESKVLGIELNPIQRNYIKEEYNFPVDDKIPIEQFDLICCYHVLEHLQYPDKKLKEFHERLNDDGHLYISVPENFSFNFDEASGMITNHFENYYHLNHVNLFSKNSLKNILGKAGFEIVKDNELMYGYTVLCRKTKNQQKIICDDYKQIVEEIKKQKKAIKLYQQEKWEEAIEAHPTYVDAWSMHAIKDFKDLAKQEELLLKAMKATEEYYKIKRQLAYLYFQWDGNKANENRLTNHIKKSKQLFTELIEERPGMEDFYYYLAMIEAKFYKNYEKARELYQIVLDINPAKYAEILNLIGWLWKEKYE